MELVRSEKSSRILRFSGFCHYYQIFKIPLFSTLKGQSKFLHFFKLEYFLFTSGRLGIIIPLQRLQVWNPNMKYTHAQRDPNSHPAYHWSIGSQFWVQADLIRLEPRTKAGGTGLAGAVLHRRVGEGER